MERRIGQEFMYKNRCFVFCFVFVLFAKSSEKARGAI